MLGAFVLGGLRVAGIDFGSPWLVTYALGIGLVVAGPVVLWRRSLSLLGHERVLTIHEDGLRWQVGESRPSFVAWADLGAMRVGEGALLVETRGGIWELPLPFEGISAEQLIKLCMELRQKALLGLRVRPREP